MDNFSLHSVVNLEKLRNMFSSNSGYVEKRGFLEIHHYNIPKLNNNTELSEPAHGTTVGISNLVKIDTPQNTVVTTPDDETKQTEETDRSPCSSSSRHSEWNVFKRHNNKISHADEVTVKYTVSEPVLDLHQRMENLFVTFKERSSDKYVQAEGTEDVSEDEQSSCHEIIVQSSTDDSDGCNKVPIDIDLVASQASEDVSTRDIVDGSGQDYCANYPVL